MSDVRTSDVTGVSSRSPRTIVLCFDGTRGQYDSMNTNVVKFFGLLRKDSPEQQVTYYQAGIGTYFAPGVVSPLWTWLASILDEALAWYLDAHVMGGYKFLMDNYRTGDKICLFGFSRGAYTARALAGMLHKVGLLPRDNLQQVNFAYKAYKRTNKEGVKLAAGFKQTFSQDVKVEFVGVWDTVQSTGMLINRILPFTDSDTNIKMFRHALSLDEHRSRFRPNLYHWPTQDSEADIVGVTSQPRHSFKSILRRLFKGKGQTVDSGPFADNAEQDEATDGEVTEGTHPDTDFVAETPFACTDVLEVWFAGCHSDIGGGSVKDDVRVSLSQITLHWMVEQVIQSRCGILFDSNALAGIGFRDLPPSPTFGVEAARSGSVVQEPLNESSGQLAPSSREFPEGSHAMAPIFDELKTRKLWWIVEIIPFSYAWQDDRGAWHSNWSIGLGRGRIIPFKKPKFHHTVKERMDYKPLMYKPRAVYDHHEVYV